MRVLIILLSLFSFANLGCKKEGNDKGRVALSLIVNIGYVDKGNNDLLDRSSPNSIKEDDIEIYYLQGDKKIHIYDPNMDLPKNFGIAKLADGKYYIQLAVNDIPDERNISTTLIEMKNKAVDTLRSELRISNTSKSITQAWYNDTLEWDGKSIASFTIVK